ncbi:pyridoxamine 5'-phosphate oxidase [Motiliproteus sp. SC1-56]|uniref:pyridoxamine 5'-phosphate oxidase n=1 Tax=Motiliproteus sp. SC1-56 TaxID=2799565 RepID=UPI001A8DE180|nr:pyridoxamine 5'-phosphate oxidase [Motiliproteus sp. SC1-56]
MADPRDLKALRREYIAEGLTWEHLDPDPFIQFQRWMEEALTVDPGDASSMVLATSTKDGCPSARVVLLKHYDEKGFCWYTDYRSQKGQELSENPQAELLFYWRALERQVRIWGRVERLEREAAEAYFASRPLGSQLSAAASQQSAVVQSREALEAQVARLAEACDGQAVPCPAQWGGYRLVPERFEFWQGRKNRLHDRMVYGLEFDGWRIVRLAP